MVIQVKLSLQMGLWHPEPKPPIRLNLVGKAGIEPVTFGPYGPSLFL